MSLETSSIYKIFRLHKYLVFIHLKFTRNFCLIYYGTLRLYSSIASIQLTGATESIKRARKGLMIQKGFLICELLEKGKIYNWRRRGIFGDKRIILFFMGSNISF